MYGGGVFSEQVEGGRNLSKRNIQKESIVRLMPRLRGSMQIFVKLLSGELVILDVKASDTIDNVRARNLPLQTSIS